MGVGVGVSVNVSVGGFMCMGGYSVQLEGMLREAQEHAAQVRRTCVCGCGCVEFICMRDLLLNLMDVPC